MIFISCCMFICIRSYLNSCLLPMYISVHFIFVLTLSFNLYNISGTCVFVFVFHCCFIFRDVYIHRYLIIHVEKYWFSISRCVFLLMFISMFADLLLYHICYSCVYSSNYICVYCYVLVYSCFIVTFMYLQICDYICFHVDAVTCIIILDSSILSNCLHEIILGYAGFC